ncbi:hypothetical protein AMTRI_Chr05g61000 [Amborella trichopoda]
MSFVFWVLLGSCISALLLLLLYHTVSNCVSSPTRAVVDNMGAINEPMEQVPYLATPHRKFIEIQDGEPDSSTKGLETNVPYVGLKFSSEEDAIDYYKAYVLAKSFGIRKGTNHNKKSQRIDREINCSKEGFHEVKDQVNGKELLESMCGCKTKLGPSRKADNEWVVTKFIDDHNHDLVSPKNARLIRSHRTISSATKLMINSMTRGIENATCTQKDIENEIASARRKLRGEDGSLIMQWLYKMKESNPSFFYRLKLNEDDHILNIL